MAAFSSVVEKRITKTTEGVASKMLEKLKGGDKSSDIEKYSFPSNLENQAQATYMVIYIFENSSNKSKFETGFLNASEGEDEWEIGAITWVKDQIASAEKWAKDKVKEAQDYVTKTAKDWLAEQKKKLEDKTQSVEFQKWNQIKDFANDYLIPKRKKSESKAVADALDPTKHPENGYKLDRAIQIQMPSSSLTYKYENGWESTDTKSLNTIRTLISGFNNLATGLFGKNAEEKEAGKRQLNAVYDQIKSSLGDVITGGGYSTAKQASERFVYNPTVIFNYSLPKPRSFDYSFTLYPRNKNELYDLFNIIQMLKFYALPEISASEQYNGARQSTRYAYPAKFAIKFYTNGYENKWFPKTRMLGLTSIEETLTGDNGDMAYFENYFDKYSGNPPRVVRLRLSFTELALMSREAAKEGF